MYLSFPYTDIAGLKLNTATYLITIIGITVGQSSPMPSLTRVLFKTIDGLGAGQLKFPVFGPASSPQDQGEYMFVKARGFPDTRTRA